MRPKFVRIVPWWIGVLAIPFLLATSAPVPGSRPAWDLPGVDWAEGPVAFLLQKAQVEAYRNLSTEEARTAFVEKFWASLDPTPETPENEFRTIFAREVEDAVTRYSEGSRPGWKTLRGRTLLMAGYPDDWREGREGEEIWTYSVRVHDPRIHNPNVKTQWVFTFGFLRQEDGSYRALKYEGHGGLKDLLQTLQGMQLTEYLNYLTARGVAPQLSKGHANPMASALNAIHPDFDDNTRMDDSLDKANPDQKFPIATAAYFFGYSKHETMVLLVMKVNTVDAQKDAAGKVLFYPLVEIKNLKDAKSYTVGALGQDRFTVFADDPSGDVTYGVSRHVSPGEYEFRAAVLSGPGGKIASRKEHITVPDFRDSRISLSSIVPARVIERSAAESNAPDYYRVGNVHLVPWAGPVRPDPEGLRLFLEVYGVKAVGKGGTLPLEITITIQGMSDSGWREVLPAPITIADPTEGPIIATVAPEIVAKWPDGQYRASVTVMDQSRHKSVSAAAEFQFLP